MKITYLLIITIFLTSCLPSKKVQKSKPNEDYLAQYILKLESQGMISDTPLIVIDGTPVSYAEYKSTYKPFSKEDIELIQCLPKEDESNVKLYGDRAKGGVILIKPSNNIEKLPNTINDYNVLVIIDGKQCSLKDLEQLNPGVIDSYDVITEEKAIKKITKKKYDGVMRVTTKKN